jgi:hypothetical protein
MDNNLPNPGGPQSTAEAGVEKIQPCSCGCESGGGSLGSSLFRSRQVGVPEHLDLQPYLTGDLPIPELSALGMSSCVRSLFPFKGEN